MHVAGIKFASFTAQIGIHKIPTEVEGGGSLIPSAPGFATDSKADWISQGSD